jgi:tungstate transport system ATP-binding protein
VTVRVGALAILDTITLTVKPGAPLAVVGPNGAGKTTLLRVAMGLTPPTQGTVSWGGRPTSAIERRAIVFQRPVMLRRSVAANIAFALNGLGLPRNERLGRTERALGQAKLAALAQRSARRLSGGEQQRLALARALAREPEILFLDEPANNPDPAATRGVEAIIREAAEAGVKIVMVTHDLGQARRLCGEVAFMVGGRLLEQGDAASFVARPDTPQAAAFLRGEIVE